MQVQRILCSIGGPVTLHLGDHSLGYCTPDPLAMGDQIQRLWEDA